MTIYVYRDGRMVDKATGEPMVDPEDWVPSVPQVFGDDEGYESPIDGKWIEGRRARRYDLEKNNCVDARELAPKEPRKLKNERFAKKWGLEHMLER